MHAAIFDYEKHHATPWHEHESGQFYWLDSGIMIVEMETSQWTVTPGSLGWFPAGIRHRAHVPGRLKGKSLYVDQPTSQMPEVTPGIFAIDSFVHALLERLHLSCGSDFLTDYQTSLLKVLRIEIERAAELPLKLRLPTDRRARNITDELLAHPDTPLSQVQLAEKWGLSVRSLSRLFREQTGLSFSQWRQQAKVTASLQWVLAGVPVGEVAALSGYSNTSAYIDVFRDRFGMTPGQMQTQKLSPTTPPAFCKHE